MTTMLELATRAAHLAHNNPDATWEEIARAVLMAVREPRIEMVMDAQDSIDEEHGVSLSVFSVSQSFTAMIDAILNEKPEVLSDV